MKQHYVPVIGVEIHIEQNTETKMFCSCRASWFGSKPNSHTCPVCLGLPGALPVPNEKAIENTLILGISFSCKINTLSKFDRKHYFYPDLPKSYQISQYDLPLAENGTYTFKTEKGNKTIAIKRIHLEEDTGKLIHRGKVSLVDLNRAGVPLMEIVTEPDFDSSESVKTFLEELRVIVRYLGISDADMEKGSMRLEPNISLKKNGEIRLPPYKVEVKNINSFKFAKRAIDFEIERQKAILESGKFPIQETRGFNEKSKKTFSQRTKEEASDYRYFPEPDIPPLYFKKAYVDALKNALPELPNERLNRYIKQWSIGESDAYILTRDNKLSNLFEKVVAILNKNKIEKGWRSKIASDIINKRLDRSKSPSVIADSFLQSQMSYDIKIEELDNIIDILVDKEVDVVKSIFAGKKGAIQYLVGCVMKEVGGKASPQDILKLIHKKIEPVKSNR